ncbi:hypothetical protein CLV63_10884 [Murinocardiopsis flavida]|uniref:Uncharacterized protein n=1 Tax=Murinocardiopsis flavida TaxID=645275 RepID=A0A2P8DJG2_9ACTN|nr:hypothetical protein [Murinocardiopsis flavida]PSK97366.1 hypothetical protein CLV63_10884 [Murinocardiopsis flavida]
MGSGRHGAARPPIGVLIQVERFDFILLTVQIVIAIVAAVAAWGNLIVLGAAVVMIAVGVTLMVRRIERLSREEVADDELL